MRFQLKAKGSETRLRAFVASSMLLGLVVVSGAGAVAASGGETLLCYGSAATIVSNGPIIMGTPGDDVIVGGDASQHIDGGGGDDVICGLGGDDAIYGGPGNDTIDGLWGDDHIDGGLGHDLLFGRSGNDRLRGGDGDDMILAGHGDDEIIGTEGIDTVRGSLGDDFILGTIGDSENDVLDGESGINQLYIPDPDAACVGAGSCPGVSIRW